MEYQPAWLVWRRGGHLCRVADNTVWSHWQLASHSFEVNFTKNYTLLYLSFVPRKLQFFFKLLHSTSPLGICRRNIAITFDWCATTRMVWLPDGGKYVMMLNRLDTIPACDGRTDGHIAMALSTLCTTSRGKKRSYAQWVYQLDSWLSTSSDRASK